MATQPAQPSGQTPHSSQTSLAPATALNSDERPAEGAIELERLRQDAAQLRAIFDNAAVGILLVSRGGIVRDANRRFAGYLGYRTGEIIGRHYHDLTAPEDIGIHSAKRDALWSGALESVSAEKRWLTRDGGRFWTRMTVSVHGEGVNGEPTSIAIIEDINESKRNEESRRLLIGELNHRVKNTLAIVQGIVRQTLTSCPDPAEFAHVIEKRLQSISRAHDLLTRNDWQSLGLDDLMRIVVLEAFPAYEPQISLKLCPVHIGAQQAITLALLFHELTTNAIKHGALSVPAGRVLCAAEVIVSRNDCYELEIRWIERGGPRPSESQNPGFGSFLMQRGVQFALDGTATTYFTEAGLDAKVRFLVKRDADGLDVNGNYFQLIRKSMDPGLLDHATD